VAYGKVMRMFTTQEQNNPSMLLSIRTTMTEHKAFRLCIQNSSKAQI